jgi:hypothetical protein
MFDGCRTDHSARIARVRVVSLVVVMLIACATVFAANAPVPFIDLPTVPTATVPGGAGFTLTVNGAGFVSGSVVNWNGSPRATTLVSAGQVTAAILASDIATASTASVTVSNPAPGGGTSNVAYFEVTSPASDVVVTGLSLDGFGNVYFLTAADFNHDGKLDLILFSTTFVNYMNVFHVAVALGNGDGTFQPEVFLGTNLEANDVVLGDFNGDGNLDLVIVNGSQIPYTFSVFLGNGDGTFQPPVVTIGQANTEYAWPVVGDFNQDGNLDIIAQCYRCNSGTGVSLLLGNGDGTFQTPVNSSAPFSTSYPLAVGDFNGDGVLDLFGIGTMFAVLPGNGDGTFQAPVESLPHGGGPGGYALNVWAADVNGDGKLDLILPAVGGGPDGTTYSASVFPGQGNGAFSDASGFVLGQAAFPPGDFNGDGKLDFVTSAEFYPFPADDLSIWTGNGDGTFAASVPIITTTGMPLYPLLQGDFNGDGKMDLLAEVPNGGLWLFLQGSFAVGVPVPGSLSFGNQTVRTTSAAQKVTLTNTGTATLTLSPVNISGANASEFGQTNTCTASLAVGASCQINVTFTPTTGGSQSATLNIPHNGIGSQTVPLTGSGDTTFPTVIVTPATLNFVPQGIGTRSSQNVMLSSPGPGTVTEPTIALTGANGNDFSEMNTCTSELLPGASCQVTVTFSPTTVGTRSANLNFSDNASGSPQKVALVGSGPNFSTSSPTPASLTVAAGQTANYTFDLEPQGGFSQTVTLTCSGAPAGAKCTVPGSIMLSSAMTVAVSVTTSGGGAAMEHSPFSSSGRWLASGLFGLPLIVSLAGVGMRRRPHVSRWTFLLLITASMLLVPACGGGGGGGSGATPAGTYVLSVSGKYTTGGTTLIHDTTFTLIVE